MISMLDRELKKGSAELFSESYAGRREPELMKGGWRATE
jgi:hypothetical protein